MLKQGETQNKQRRMSIYKSLVHTRSLKPRVHVNAVVPSAGGSVTYIRTKTIKQHPANLKAYVTFKKKNQTEVFLNFLLSDAINATTLVKLPK